MKRSDMHIHTTWSDGSLSPWAVVALAARLGLGEIAVTDHDTMAGCHDALEAGKALGIPVTPGVEISAYDYGRGRKVHLLGYHIQDMEALEQTCRPYLQSRHQAQLVAVERIASLGYPITREDALAYTGPSGILYRQHTMHALMDRGYATSVYGGLYTALFAKGAPAFVPSTYMDVMEALALILDTGGIPVLAHPYAYDSLDLLPELVDRGLAGLEVWHSKHSPEQICCLGELAERHSLRKFGGSDFHGLYSEFPISLGARRQDLTEVL